MSKPVVSTSVSGNWTRIEGQSTSAKTEERTQGREARVIVVRTVSGAEQGSLVALNRQLRGELAASKTLPKATKR
jgi:hypothetical protein